MGWRLGERGTVIFGCLAVMLGHSSGTAPAGSKLCRRSSVKRRTMDARLGPIAIYPSSWYSLCRGSGPCAKFLKTLVDINTVYVLLLVLHPISRTMSGSQ